MPAVMSPTQEYPVTPQVAPNYGRNPGDVSADLLVFNLPYFDQVVMYTCIYIVLLLFNQARKAELDRRQAELDRREEELRNASTNGTYLLVLIIN